MSLFDRVLRALRTKSEIAYSGFPPTAEAAMTYRLFIANKNYSSWSMRPWVLLRALEIPFEEVLTPFALFAHRQGSLPA